MITTSDGGSGSESASCVMQPIAADLFGAVVAWFNANRLDTVFPGDIWNGYAPAGTNPPYVVMKSEGMQTRFIGGTPNHLEVAQLRLDNYSDSAAEVEAHGQALERAFNNARLPLGDGYVMALLRRNQRLAFIAARTRAAQDQWRIATTYAITLGRDQDPAV